LYSSLSFIYQRKDLMIPYSTVSLALSLANGVIKLSIRWDKLKAEQRATQEDLALVQPTLSGLTTIRLTRELTQFLDETERQVPDPVGADDRQRLRQMFQEVGTSAGDYFPYYGRLFPDRVLRQIDPNDAFVKKLNELGYTDQDMQLAAFYIAPGDDQRKVGYPWRLGLAVADVVAEFGAENAALFARDKNLQRVAHSVLTRFANPDLASMTSWQGLLSHTLQATINGALDARESLGAGNEWVDAVVGALDSARLQADDPENFIAGLLRGNGYKLLISSALDTAATKLGSDDASAYERIASDLLSTAAPLVQENANGFKDFFENHWGDLLRAGFTSLAHHGPTLLKDESPILRDSLIAITKQLAATPNSTFLNRDLLIDLANTAITAVASRTGELTVDVDPPWLKELITSVTGVVSDQGIRNTFSQDGVESLVKRTLTALADHPEVVVKKPGLVKDVVGGVLTQLIQTPSFAALDLGTAAVEGLLQGVSTSPALLDHDAGQAAAQFAGMIAEQMQQRTLTKLQGTDVLRAALSTLADHPELIESQPGLLRSSVASILDQFKGVETFGASDLATAAVDGFLKAVATSPDLLDSNWGKTVVAFSGLIAQKVEAEATSLTSRQGKDILQVAAMALAQNPQLFQKLDDGVAKAVLEAVLASTSNGSEQLLSSPGITRLIVGLLDEVGLNGRKRIDTVADTSELIGQLSHLIQAGLTVATGEMGDRLNRSKLPDVLIGLASDWFTSEMETIDPNTEAFRNTFRTAVARI
jgi:hypothetical protein